MKPRLTAQEAVILCALANGAHSKDMAALIKRSLGTVEAHIRSLFLKLNAESRPQLVTQAFRHGILVIDQGKAARLHDSLQRLAAPQGRVNRQHEPR